MTRYKTNSWILSSCMRHFRWLLCGHVSVCSLHSLWALKPQCLCVSQNAQHGLDQRCAQLCVCVPRVPPVQWFTVSALGHVTEQVALWCSSPPITHTHLHVHPENTQHLWCAQTLQQARLHTAVTGKNETTHTQYSQCKCHYLLLTLHIEHLSLSSLPSSFVLYLRDLWLTARHFVNFVFENTAQRLLLSMC